MSRLALPSAYFHYPSYYNGSPQSTILQQQVAIEFLQLLLVLYVHHREPLYVKYTKKCKQIKQIWIGYY